MRSIPKKRRAAQGGLAKKARGPKNGAKDADAKLKGERMCARGGRIAKKKALVAVARCLVVTAVALLKKPEAKYVPLSEAGRREFEAMRAA